MSSLFEDPIFFTLNVLALIIGSVLAWHIYGKTTARDSRRRDAVFPCTAAGLHANSREPCKRARYKGYPRQARDTIRHLSSTGR
ncbi:unnamed protein product [Peniophora sp. CBMAI 1063]|nr:unnamed protein product [Peniophora sp. CBMAI 1063]